MFILDPSVAFTWLISPSLLEILSSLGFPDSRIPRFSSHYAFFLFFNKFFFFSLIIIYLFIFIFLAALGLHCCMQAFSSCGERGLLFVAVRRLLIVMASLVAEHGL